MHQITPGDLPVHQNLILVKNEHHIGQIRPNPLWWKKMVHFRLAQNNEKSELGAIELDSPFPPHEEAACKFIAQLGYYLKLIIELAAVKSLWLMKIMLSRSRNNFRFFKRGGVQKT